MEIVSIFDKEICELLWTASYKNDVTGEHEEAFHKVFKQWGNTEWLFEYFNENKEKLQTKFWNNMTVEDAVMKAQAEVMEFRKMIYEIAHKGRYKSYESISEIFFSLTETDYHLRHVNKRKAKPDGKHPFLRLYGISLDQDAIIVTGGSVKLTREMKDCDYLKRELKRMDSVKLYLKEQGIEYLDDLISY